MADFSDFFSTPKKDETPSNGSSLLDSLMDFNEFSSTPNTSTTTSAPATLDVLALLDLDQSAPQNPSATDINKPVDIFSTQSPFDTFANPTVQTSQPHNDFEVVFDSSAKPTSVKFASMGSSQSLDFSSSSSEQTTNVDNFEDPFRSSQESTVNQTVTSFEVNPQSPFESRNNTQSSQNSAIEHFSNPISTESSPTTKVDNAVDYSTTQSSTPNQPEHSSHNEHTATQETPQQQEIQQEEVQQLETVHKQETQQEEIPQQQETLQKEDTTVPQEEKIVEEPQKEGTQEVEEIQENQQQDRVEQNAENNKQEEEEEEEEKVEQTNKQEEIEENNKFVEEQVEQQQNKQEEEQVEQQQNTQEAEQVEQQQNKQEEQETNVSEEQSFEPSSNHNTQEQQQHNTELTFIDHTSEEPIQHNTQEQHNTFIHETSEEPIEHNTEQSIVEDTTLTEDLVSTPTEDISPLTSTDSQEEEEESIPSELKCPYCNNMFQVPKLLLPCLHTFCQKCISDFTSKGVKLCQLCNTEIELPQFGGVTALPDDFMTVSILGISSLKDQKAKPCDLCDDPSDTAIVYCKECTRFLCSDHMNTHKKDRVTKSHILLTMEELKEDMELQKKTNKTVFCDKHMTQELLLFCESCDLAICRDCSVLDHKDHKISFIKDVYELNKSIMDELMMKTKSYKDTLESAVLEVTQIQSKLQDNCNTATSLIRSSFDQLRKELEARESLLLSQIENTLKVKGESLQTQYMELSNQLIGVSSSYSFTQRAFDTGNDVAIMQLKGPIMKRLMDVTGSRIESKPREDDSIEFTASTLQTLSEEISTLGSVDSNSAFGPLSMTTTVPTSMKDKQISFLVTVRDNKNQIRTRGGDIIEIKISSANGDLPYIINDNKNGTYSVNFITSVEGQNRVNVLVRGVHVQNSPFNVFVSTSVDYTKIGKATKKFGTQGKSNGQFNGPRAIAVNSQGKYIVVDSDNHRIQFFDQNFKYCGQFGSKGSNDGQFIAPSDIALTAKDQIIIADKGNNRIQVFEPNGKFSFKFGTAGNGNGQFLDPVSVAINIDAEIIYVADQNNHRIQAFNTKGQFMFTFGNRGTGDGQFKNPTGVAINKTTGEVVICDRLNNRVQLFNKDGNFIRKFGHEGSADGQFNFPWAVTVAPSGHLIVSDQSNHRVQIFSETGQLIHRFGAKGSGDAQFKDPSGLMINSAGFIFVCDFGNNRINLFG